MGSSFVAIGKLKNRQMKGEIVPVMRMATIPQANQEIDDSPGSVGIGKMLR